MFNALPPESAIRALCTAHLRPLTEALERAEAYGYKRGYEQGARDALSPTDESYNLHAGAPTWEELQKLRGLRFNAETLRWEPIPGKNDYPGGRWPGRNWTDVE